MASADDEENPFFDPGSSIDVPEENIAMLIGRAGANIKRLQSQSGCKITIPKERSNPMKVDLAGTLEQRKHAIKAVKDLIAGGDVEDQFAAADGAMVLPHGLVNEEGGSKFDHQAWAAWRLIPVEREYGVRVEMGKKAVRLYATSGALRGRAAEDVRAATENVLSQARALCEATVSAKPELEPENVKFEPGVHALIDQSGVLVHAPVPEDGVVPIKVVGTEKPARDVVSLLEEKYVNGKFIHSVLHAPDQLTNMEEETRTNFLQDVQHLETEKAVKINEGGTCLWLAGADQFAVDEARSMLKEMLEFYVEKGFARIEGLNQRMIDEKLRPDASLRQLRSRADCAVSFDITLDGDKCTAWIAGEKALNAVKTRITAMMDTWASEHWELTLEDMGVAYWLLGPQGSGTILNQMMHESGTKIKVDPIYLTVTAEGSPEGIEKAKALILQSIERLEAKKREKPAGGNGAISRHCGERERSKGYKVGQDDQTLSLVGLSAKGKAMLEALNRLKQEAKDDPPTDEETAVIAPSAPEATVGVAPPSPEAPVEPPSPEAPVEPPTPAD